MKREFRLYRKPNLVQERDAISGRTIKPVATSTGLGGGSAPAAAVTGEPPATGAGIVHAETPWENYLGYHVVDTNNEVIGKLNALWTDQSGQPAYLGVRTFWFGKTHVFPAESAEMDTTRERIRVPYTVDSVREAPLFAADDELGIEDERIIREYFAACGYQRYQPPRENPAEQAPMPLSGEEVTTGIREGEDAGRLHKFGSTETPPSEEPGAERGPAGESRGQTGQEPEKREGYVPFRRES